MIKIMIADDQELIRESLKIILSTKEEFRVIATVGSGKEVIEAIRREQPDVILMDMRMPDMDGVHCTKFVKEVYPDVKVIVLTTFDDDEYVYSALKYGASGYLLKGVSLDELSNAIKTVLQGGAIFNPNGVSKIFGGLNFRGQFRGLNFEGHFRGINPKRNRWHSSVSFSIMFYWLCFCEGGNHGSFLSI